MFLCTLKCNITIWFPVSGDSPYIYTHIFTHRFLDLLRGLHAILSRAANATIFSRVFLTGLCHLPFSSFSFSLYLRHTSTWTKLRIRRLYLLSLLFHFYYHHSFHFLLFFFHLVFIFFWFFSHSFFSFFLSFTYFLFSFFLVYLIKFFILLYFTNFIFISIILTGSPWFSLKWKYSVVGKCSV